MGELMSAGREPTISNVADELQLRRQLHRVDGLTGLVTLDEQSLKNDLPVGYARIVIRKSAHRRAYPVAESLEACIRSAGNPDEICQLASDLQSVYANIGDKAHGESFKKNVSPK